MCGIAGALRLDGGTVEPAALHSMATVLRHRGPDESAVWHQGPVGFAHTRLSIIDLAGSHQPMTSADGLWTLVFNGEIFNYEELRRTLDYPFLTDGDTEVLLAGISVHGLGFVERLRGQFAFAAYEHGTGSLHLVRDRLGVLPLHHLLDRGVLLFGSEVKALRAGVDRTLGVDLLSLDSYLGSRSVSAPDTLVEGVKKVLPGHRVEVTRDGTLHQQRYWQPPAVDVARAWTPDEAVDAVDTAVRDAVRAALVADVPVGAYLSGGVDSSLIVAVMKAVREHGDVTTFAAGFGDPRHDELKYARAVSEHVGTQHHEVHVSATEFESLWPTLTWHRDAPLSEPADVAVFRLAQAARQHVSVVLSGEGGDELFGGYPKYRYASAIARADKVPAVLRRTVGAALDPLLTERRARLRIALRAAAAPDERTRAETWFAPFTAPERDRLLGTVPSRPRDLSPLDGVDAVDRLLRHDLRSWLPDNLLERGDRMSMAASLELRPPLLDHRLAELAFSMPSEVKVRDGVTKWVLKEVARRYVPAAIVDRPKVGFRVPLDAWFRGSLRDTTWDLLTSRDSFVAGTLDPTAVRSLLERHESGRFNEESRLWTLMSLEVWHRECAGAPASGPTPSGVSR